MIDINGKKFTPGFTFCLHGRDYFIPSNLVKRTDGLAKKILKKLGYYQNEQNIAWMKSHLQRCDMTEEKYGLKLCGDRYGNRFTLYIPNNEREDFIELEVI